MNKVLAVLLILVSGGFVFYYGSNQGWFTKSATPDSSTIPTVITPTVTETVTPTSTPTTNIPKGWSTFTSEKYGFSISYPSSYKALTDKENLYGWPKAVVLIYGGGQSYDLVIERWDTRAEIEAKYKGEERVVIKKVGTNFISLFNMNKEAEVDEIIETFEITGEE